MAISDYVRPHLEVHQLMQEVVTASSDHRGACVVGANYLLHRYGQEELEPTTFNADGVAIPFTFEQQNGYDYDVDLDSVSVNAEGLEASLATFENKMKVDTTNILGVRLLSDTELLSATTETGLAKLSGDLHGLPVQIGDIVYVKTKAASEARRRVVTGLLGKQEASSTTAGLASNSAITFTTEGTYIGAKDTTYVLAVEAVGNDASKWSGAKLRVTDTDGVDVTDTISVSGDAPTIAVGTKGVSVKLNALAGSIAVGDTFSVICYAATVSTTEFNGVVLSAMPTDLADRGTAQLASVEFRKEYSGVIPSNDTGGAGWTATTDGVVLSENLTLHLNSRTSEQDVPFTNEVGKVYVSYRVLIIPKDPDEDVVLIATTADIQEHFGTIAPENELAYGCSCALTGSEGRPIYAIRTAGVDADAFYKAVKKTEADDSVYSFAILTDSVEVMDRVVEFNLAQSQPEIMKWRRTLVGVDAPGEYLLANKDAENKPINAVFAADASGKNVLVQISESSVFSLKEVALNGGITEVRAGDIVQLLSTGAKYTISAVLSDRELILDNGPATAISLATPVAIWKADTTKNAAEYVTTLSKHFNNRRVVVVWCDHGTAEEVPKATPNAFLAAEIAGLCSRVEPQQGITKFEIRSIDSAPRMYTQHTIASLDSIAKEGVMIVTQNVKGEPCFIRHQLTTETDKGILYYEDSCTRNLDAISYSVAEVLEKYIGKANVVKSALAAIELDVRTVLDSYLSNATSALVGPALVSWEGLTVQQHPTFKDRVIINVNLYLPAPLNVVQVYEMAFIADLTIAA